MIAIRMCGVNQLYFEAYDDDKPGIVGLGLTEEGARANFHKCVDDQYNFQAIRMMEEMVEAEGAEA